jgi:4-hydroxy-tetrahydrodipicolinate synthase
MGERRDFIKKGLLGAAAAVFTDLPFSTPSYGAAFEMKEPAHNGKLNKLPHGLWSVMLTPFLENKDVDIAGLKKLTEFYIQSGASGLFANCASSEMYLLTDAERLLIIQTTLKAAQGKVPVVASGTFSNSVNKCADFIQQVYDTGVAAVIVITSQLAGKDENDDVFKKRTEQLLKLTGNIPLGVYECPSPYKRLLSPELMKWLGESGRFFYHKDTSCDPEAIKLKIKAVEHTPFSFFNADTPTALVSLKNGGAGLSPISANFYPELYVELIRRVNNPGSEKELNRLSARLTVMDSSAGLFYPMSAKMFLQQRGLPITSVCRVSRREMRASDQLRFAALMEMYKETLEQL